MKISIFGMGYVGVVSAACLASRGHSITGVDTNRTKVDLINKGKSPIIEQGVEELVYIARKTNRLNATDDVKQAVEESDISFICVGTPSRPNGSLETKYIENVSSQIASVLKNKKEPHIIVYRSTMLPGTTRETIIPLLEKTSGKEENKDFFVAFNPEFLRESTAVNDFYNPQKTIVGTNNEEVSNTVLDLYQGLSGKKIKTELEIAEMVKYVDNNFHALKITFANEIGNICKKIGIDSHKVMDIFVQDTKLNISPTYLKPGFAFGGSCLPKDIRAITYLSKMLDLDVPMLNSLMNSNNSQITNAVKQIESFGKKKIGIAGFSFKHGTDDLRESPIVTVIETLIGKGFDLKLYDKNVSLARLTGANKEYINKHISHISELLVDSIDELLADREVLVIGNKSPEFERIITESKDNQIVFDLVRLKNIAKTRGTYEGIAWEIEKRQKPFTHYLNRFSGMLFETFQEKENLSYE